MCYSFTTILFRYSTNAGNLKFIIVVDWGPVNSFVPLSMQIQFEDYSKHKWLFTVIAHIVKGNLQMLAYKITFYKGRLYSTRGHLSSFIFNFC